MPSRRRACRGLRRLETWSLDGICFSFPWTASMRTNASPADSRRAAVSTQDHFCFPLVLFRRMEKLNSSRFEGRGSGHGRFQVPLLHLCLGGNKLHPCDRATLGYLVGKWFDGKLDCAVLSITHLFHRGISLVLSIGLVPDRRRVASPRCAITTMKHDPLERDSCRSNR